MGGKKRLMRLGDGKQEAQDEAREAMKGKFMQNLVGHMTNNF